MTEIYPYLILVGMSILVAAGWLLLGYRKQIAHSQKLIHLNEELNYDLPDFLRKCWPHLKESGFQGIRWSLHWFGTTVQGENGKCEGSSIDKELSIQEITLRINLYLKNRNPEYLYYCNALAENLFLLVRMNIWIKLGTVKGAFEQSAKMNVFLQHDVKNMTQLIKLLADQMQTVSPHQEAILLESMREALPAIRDRAEHMLDTLTNKPPEIEASNQDARSMLEQTAKIYDLPVKIEGQGEVSVSQRLLQSIFDNLLGNYSREINKETSKSADLSINIQKNEDKTEISITDNHGEPCKWPERLFEPFWSEYGSGRGIGLYQARQLAVSAGGSLKILDDSDKPLVFILELPSNM